MPGTAQQQQQQQKQQPSRRVSEKRSLSSQLDATTVTAASTVAPERVGLRAVSPVLLGQAPRPTPAQAHRYGYPTELPPDVAVRRTVLLTWAFPA